MIREYKNIKNIKKEQKKANYGEISTSKKPN